MGMKKTIRLLLVLVLSALFITGCSKETVCVPITGNTIEVTEGDELIGYLVEPFDKEYYDILNEKTVSGRIDIKPYEALILKEI